ncbi:unnamed protein product (macronuclear) [Paramecium tetraurelia]|uniref:MaoC-like domain-containing protein n=1 Tax=Paramecium tetraurelia TaxID=5888 RepID=A0CIH5_PARTE|nr:uncharacterized protein GSPATT00007727001 [Paramecium tetraurelia]CAK70592.1 unnamed protein product [Paramecium tetraurelia]|eukprot:XP_001437989.1 hypothetical protein (macronuclear) [Paramecium tetraurelia strain d4-2]
MKLRQIQYLFSQYHIGKLFKLERIFTEEDVRNYANLIKDFNPIHLDKYAASQSIFKERVVHGMLSASLFSTLVGTNFPGCIYLEQSINFKAPIFLDEQILAQVLIQDIKHTKGRQILKLNTTIEKMDQKIAVTGQATILIN